MWQLQFSKTRGNKNKQWTHSTPVNLPLDALTMFWVTKIVCIVYVGHSQSYQTHCSQFFPNLCYKCWPFVYIVCVMVQLGQMSIPIARIDLGGAGPPKSGPLWQKKNWLFEPYPINSPTKPAVFGPILWLKVDLFDRLGRGVSMLPLPTGLHMSTVNIFS